MTTGDILTVLKTDLKISTTAYDDFLTSMVEAATAAITREGITLNDSIEDGMLVEQYAAYLYRKRNEGDTGYSNREGGSIFPRHLRWQLNNRLLSEKAGGA